MLVFRKLMNDILDKVCYNENNVVDLQTDSIINIKCENLNLNEKISTEIKAENVKKSENELKKEIFIESVNNKFINQISETEI